MTNKIILIGNVGRDPEIRTTQDGKEVVSFSVATSKSWKDRDGAKQTDTQWHNIAVFGGLVNIVKSYVKKGSKLYIEGSMKYEKYEKNGETKHTAKVVLSGFNSSLVLLDSKTENSGLDDEHGI